MAAAPAAPAKGQGLAVAGCNYVAQDQIWKDHINQETVASKKWPQNWEFMTTKYEDLVKDDFKARLEEKANRAPLTPVLAIPPVTPLQERVKVYPSTKNVPVTASAMIGWRSTEERLKLEKYGGYAKPKGSIVKSLNWPLEAVE